MKYGRDTGLYRWFRQQVLERDKHTCQICGRKDNLHVHHLFPVSKHKKYIYVVKFGIVICRFCHRITYRREEAFIDLFLKIINKKQLSKTDKTLFDMILKQKKPRLFKGGIKMACKTSKKTKKPTPKGKC